MKGVSMKAKFVSFIRKLLSPLFAGEGGIFRHVAKVEKRKEEPKQLPCNFYSEF